VAELHALRSLRPLAEGGPALLSPAAKQSYLLASAGAALVSVSAHLILVFPFNLVGLIAGFACYFRALAGAEARRTRFAAGYLFGALSAVGSLYWIADVLNVLTLGERIAGVAVIGGFLLLIALPYGLWGLAPRWQHLQAAGLLLIQALVHDVWLEFPWLHHGYWLVAGPFRGWLGILGARGSGLLLLSIAAYLGHLRLRPRAQVYALIAAATLCAILVYPAGATGGPGDRQVDAAVVAIDRTIESDSERDDLDLLARYVVATRALDAQWVVWPESVIRDGEASAQALAAMLADQRGRVLAGGLFKAEGGRHNAVVDLRSGDRIYYKQKLVPFSEYLPGTVFRTLFARLGISTLKSNVIAWERPQRPLEIDGVTVIPLICFEVAFAELVQPDDRPVVLLNVGNESWFRSAILHRMTLAIGAARALEHGVPLLRSVSGGYSGAFDPSAGRLGAQLSSEGAVVSRRALLRPRPSTTLYGRLSRMGRGVR
jgi:apolipoprotein N-acyltransferase